MSRSQIRRALVAFQGRNARYTYIIKHIFRGQKRSERTIPFLESYHRKKKVKLLPVPKKKCVVV